MKKDKRYVIPVIPLTHATSLNRHIFSYTFDSPLPTGSLVEIPFGKNRITRGIVTESEPSATAPKAIKSIRKIISPALLRREHIAFAEYIVQEYFGSVGLVLNLFLPSKVKKRNTQKSPERQLPQKIQLTLKQQKASKDILTSKEPSLLTGPPSSGKTEVLIDLTKKILQEKKQVLFLLPEITLTPHTIERMIRRLGDHKISIFHSGLTARQRGSVWQYIASGNSRVVIGSRSALFLPFQKLGLVIVDEEHDDSHKQTLKSPRYDARILAEKLASLYGAKTVFCSSTPRAETLFQVSNKNIHLVTLPILPQQKSISPPQIQIVNMRLAHWKSKQKRVAPPLFSEELIAELYNTLKKKEQALLLVSRQGMNAFSLCTSCKNIFRCPKCDRALVPQRSGHFLCLGGHFRTQAFPKCPVCGNLQFIGHGIGTQRVEDQISRLFPYARIARLDSQSSKKKSLRESIISGMLEKKIDILVGTQMIAKGWDIPNLSLIGIIDSDSFFSLPDYSADARIAQLFFQARGRLGRFRSTSPGILFIQTYHSERPLFSFLKKNDYAGFIKGEMETRQALNYPPYCRLLRLVGKDTDDGRLRTQGLTLYKELTHIKDASLVLSRPAKSPKRQKIGFFSRQIVIKNSSPSISPPIRKILENIPKNWYIDNDAISIS